MVSASPPLGAAVLLSLIGCVVFIAKRCGLPPNLGNAAATAAGVAEEKQSRRACLGRALLASDRANNGQQEVPAFGTF